MDHHNQKKKKYKPIELSLSAKLSDLGITRAHSFSTKDGNCTEKNKAKLHSITPLRDHDYY